MIELRHIRKEFSDASTTSTPLKDVNCVINDGDVISIIGSSGTGKSTLLRAINMLSAPTSGDILVDGECITAPGYDISKVRKKIGMVFQSFNLFNHLTVIENIMKPQIDLLKVDKQTAYDKAIELLRTVGLVNQALKYPEQLSGGQKQRVAICRTLAMDPEIILFDEPTSALDPKMINEVEVVIRLLAKQGHTMMIVTHELNFAKTIANRVFYMDEGGIYEDGSPEQIFEHPLKEKTRIFIKQLKTLEFNIDNRNFDFAGVAYKIIEFGYKNQMDMTQINRVQAVFEELGKGVIIPTFYGPFNMNVEIEYDDKNHDTTITFKYDGPMFNPRTSDNKISMKIFENSISTYSYQQINEDKYTNKLMCVIK